jgi:uncharacterized membrane protein YeaQ/YmgE (transglycosylase-associated protein family)
MYVPAPPRVAHRSPEVRELSHKIESVIREYQQTHRLSPLELQQALRIAEANTGASKRSAGMLAGVVAGLIGLAVVGGLFFSQQAERAPDGSSPVMVGVIGIAVVTLAVVVAVRRFRGS